MSRLPKQTNLSKPLGGRYKILSELGAGGFGHTFLAEDLHLPGHPQCVVKQLKPQTSDPKSLQMARRLFDTEAEVLYQLGNHDQIPRLFAHFEENQEFYLAQELIQGEQLTQELVPGEPWPEVRVLALLQDILQVLAFVHEQQVIHRDLKPPNLIRRRQDGKIVLIDFGAVKQVSTPLNELEAGQGTLTISIGTKGYMPNEQLAGTPRFSSDVYAVGMLAIQALTGIHPKRLPENPQTGEVEWRSHAAQISPEVGALIDCMVRYDFRDRYPTAAEALEALHILPASILESLSSSEDGSEATAIAPEPGLETSSTQAESTESESEMELSPTNTWTPTEPVAKTGKSFNSKSPTEVDPQPDPTTSKSPTEPLPTLHLWRGSEATSATLGLVRRWSKFWPALAVLFGMGSTFWLTKTFLSPQLTIQTAARSGALVNSPTPNPVPKATPPPRKLQPAELLSQADQLRVAGQYQEALKFYAQAIAGQPNQASAYWGRCYSLNKLQKPAEALVACNDALALKRNYPEALWSKGNALDQQKQTIEALDLYEQATELKPSLAEAWIDMGAALQSVGRSVEAIDALDKGIALNRDSAKAWSTRGTALWNLGRFDEAIPSLDKALELQPDNQDILKIRQRLRKELGR